MPTKNLGKTDSAKHYYEQTLIAYEELEFTNMVATSFNRLGGLYLSLNDLSTAYKYYNQALELKHELSNSVILSETYKKHWHNIQDSRHEKKGS